MTWFVVPEVLAIQVVPSIRVPSTLIFVTTSSPLGSDETTVIVTSSSSSAGFGVAVTSEIIGVGSVGSTTTIVVSTASDLASSLSITTTETNSKILVFCSVNGLEKNNLNNYGKLYLYKSTTLVLRWEAWIGYGLVMAYYPGSGALGSSSLTYLDSPTHTSGDTLTYNVYFSAHSGNFSVNVVPSKSIITLMEIGA